LTHDDDVEVHKSCIETNFWRAHVDGPSCDMWFGIR
jgi:hypothetical protein